MRVIRRISLSARVASDTVVFVCVSVVLPVCETWSATLSALVRTYAYANVRTTHGLSIIPSGKWRFVCLKARTENGAGVNVLITRSSVVPVHLPPLVRVFRPKRLE